MTGKVVLVGALDTKGVEYLFVKNILELNGVPTFTINTGILGDPVYIPDISADQVAQAAGADLKTLVDNHDRGIAVATMTKGVRLVMEELVKNNELAGVFGMGGTAGTNFASSAMKAVAVGVPKMIVSTVASGNTRPYVGTKDICMMHSVIDISGINVLSSLILSNAACALAGMAKTSTRLARKIEPIKPLIGLTMFGVTTPCCTQVREILEKSGYDVLVFHATGSGGMAMEELIQSGFLKGIVDVTTTELADELVGGVFSAGPNRLLAAGETGIPQVVSVGALDMVNFYEIETVPNQFADRKFYQHNATTTLMRTTVEENAELGRQLGKKVSQTKSSVVVLFPRGGVSMLDTEGMDFDGPEERRALLEGIKETLHKDIPLIEVDTDINHTDTAELIAQTFINLMNQHNLMKEELT